MKNFLKAEPSAIQEIAEQGQHQYMASACDARPDIAQVLTDETKPSAGRSRDASCRQKRARKRGGRVIYGQGYSHRYARTNTRTDSDEANTLPSRLTILTRILFAAKALRVTNYCRGRFPIGLTINGQLNSSVSPRPGDTVTATARSRCSAVISAPSFGESIFAL